MTIKNAEKPIYVYDAAYRWNWRTRFKEVIRYKYLLQSLINRNLKARYKDSRLGILWSLLNPLGLMLVFTILFTVLGRGGDIRQFPVFILVAIIPWRFFSGSLMSSTASIVGNSALIKKVYFPREMLPVAVILTELVNFLIGFALLVLFLLWYDLGLTVHALWVPFILVTQITFSLGLGFLLSTLNTFYRDVRMILDVVLQAWFFLTPIFYSFETLFDDSVTVAGITFDPAQVMRWLNPMASLIDGYRTVLWGTMSSNGAVGMNPDYLLRTFVQVFIILIIGYTVFIRNEHLFGEKM
jgi:lipopolysaccharide transport system permease protein